MLWREESTHPSGRSKGIPGVEVHSKRKSLNVANRVAELDKAPWGEATKNSRELWSLEHESRVGSPVGSPGGSVSVLDISGVSGSLVWAQ